MGRGSRRQAFKNTLIYRALQVGSGITRALPLPAARRTGAVLGGLAYRIVPRERVKALRHIATAFPQLSVAEQSHLAKRAFVHLGTSLAEIAWLPRLDQARFAATTRIEGAENLRAAVDAGRGVVLFTGHCGNWEWMAASIALAGFTMKVIAREIYDPRLNEYIMAMRGRFGVESIGRGSTGAAREILSTLRAGSILGVLIDQNIRAETALVPFFGIPAPTPIGPAQIAIRAGAMVISGFIERRDSLQHVHFDVPMETRREDDPVALTAEMTRRIEQQIRRAPEQWVWMHDRWRER